MSIEVQAFNSFPGVPSPRTITLFEAEAKLHSYQSSPEQPTECTSFTDILKDYHYINGCHVKSIFPFKNVDPVSKIKIKSFILPENQSIVKGLWTSFLDNGLQGIREFVQKLERSSRNDNIVRIVELMSRIVLAYQNVWESSITYIYPHYKMEPEELVQAFVPIRDWGTSWIKAMAWHPSQSRLAIGLKDDTIRIFTTGNSVVPTIRSDDQEMVASIAFRPYLQSEMAVAVEKGVLIWQIPTNNSIKPRKGQSKLYSLKGHSPVSCVNYSNSGHVLMSSSPMDNSIIIWMRSFSGYECLHRLSGGGVPLSLWSPNDLVIFSTTPSSLFRLWEVKSNWTPRNFNTSGKPVEAACWSPCSKMLMFACDSCLYVLHLQISEVDKLISNTNSKSKIVPVFDLRECLVNCENDQFHYKVGGKVRQLVWDPTGTRVAMFFDDSELIALFRVQPLGRNFLDPVGFIRGHPGEYPVGMIFQNAFNDGALLVIAYVSGRVQYIPLLFVNQKTQKNIFHMDNYRLPMHPEVRPAPTSQKPLFSEEMYTADETGEIDPRRLFSAAM